MKKYCTASEFGDLDMMEMGGDTSKLETTVLIRCGVEMIVVVLFSFSSELFQE